LENTGDGKNKQKKGGISVLREDGNEECQFKEGQITQHQENGRKRRKGLIKTQTIKD